MAAGVPMTSVSNPGRGLGVKQVLIRSVEPGGDRVLATDPGGLQIELPYNICRTGRWPVPGDTWIIDRSLGFWSLAAFVGVPSDTIPTGPAGGDLGGSYPDPTVNRIHGVALSGTPTAGQVPAATGPAAAAWHTLIPSDVSGLGNAAVKNVGTSAGTVAAGDDGRITGALQAVNNLSDLPSPATGRASLGLGGAAVLAVGTSAGTVAAGDDSRITGAVPKSLATTKGDLFAATGAGTIVRLGAGADGTVLSANSGASAGLSYITLPASGGDNAPPSLNALVAWAYDHLSCNSSDIMSVGTTFYTRIIVPAAVTATNIVIYASGGGGGLTSGQCFAGLYNSAGTRLGVTADQSGHWVGVPQVQIMALAGGAVSLTAGVYYAALLCNGTTGPSLISCNNGTNQARMGEAAAPFRFNKDSGGNTSLPSTVTLSGLTNPNKSMWVALS